MTNLSFNISGGSEKARYSVSTGYFKQDGIVRGTSFDRFNVRFNGDLDVSKRLKVGNSTTISRTTEIAKNTYDPFNSLLLLAAASPPTIVPKNTDGTYAGGDANKDGYTEPNPVYDIEVPNSLNTRYRTISSVYAEYEPLMGLKLRANLGFDMVLQNVRNQSPATPSSGGRPITITGFNESTNYNPSLLSEYTATYTRKIATDHNISVLGGYTAQQHDYNVLGGSRSGYARTDLWVLDDAATVPTSTAQIGNYSGRGTTKLETYVGRFTYDYQGKYLFAYTIRRDGSSNFGPLNRYASFQSASIGWNVTDEKFMEAIPQISLLKVRASYGQTGNQNVNQFAYLAKINSGIQYPFGDNSAGNGANSGAATTATSNPNIRWEKNIQSNIGIDLGLFSNRLNITMDLYQRTSKDLILSVTPTATSGTYESVPYNTGEMVNKGIDLGINTVNLGPNSPLNWTSNFVLSSYSNNVTSLGLGTPILNGITRMTGGGLRVTSGDPIFYFYGFQTDGIYQNAEEVKNGPKQTVGSNSATSTSPGDIRFKDINGDGKIDEKDRTNLGNSIPNFTYGFTNTFKYKIFDLSIFFQGSEGNKVLNFTRWYTESGIANSNYSNRVIARWTGPGTTNTQPRVIQSDPNQNNRISDRFIEDATYIRLKNITLGISLPEAITKRLGTGKMRLYGSIQNAFTLTNYTGFDPEVGGGVDYGFYPQARTYLFGFNLSF
jgi:TonB-linked SusC/RagA family outer membrane protein